MRDESSGSLEANPIVSNTDELGVVEVQVRRDSESDFKLAQEA